MIFLHFKMGGGTLLIRSSSQGNEQEKADCDSTGCAWPRRYDTPPNYTNPTASWSRVRILPLFCMLQTKCSFMKSPTSRLLCFGGGKVAGGRSKDQEGPQQCQRTASILPRRAQPGSLAASFILQGPPLPMCKCTVHLDSTVQAMGWVPTKTFCLHGGRTVPPSAKTKSCTGRSMGRAWQPAAMAEHFI